VAATQWESSVKVQVAAWHCPCHGFRYDPRDGHVLNGPAITGLAAAEE